MSSLTLTRMSRDEVLQREGHVVPSVTCSLALTRVSRDEVLQREGHVVPSMTCSLALTRVSRDEVLERQGHVVPSMTCSLALTRVSRDEVLQSGKRHRSKCSTAATIRFHVYVNTLLMELSFWNRHCRSVWLENNGGVFFFTCNLYRCVTYSW